MSCVHCGCTAPLQVLADLQFPRKECQRCHWQTPIAMEIEYYSFNQLPDYYTPRQPLAGLLRNARKGDPLDALFRGRQPLTVNRLNLIEKARTALAAALRRYGADK